MKKKNRDFSLTIGGFFVGIIATVLFTQSGIRPDSQIQQENIVQKHKIGEESDISDYTNKRVAESSWETFSSKLYGFKVDYPIFSFPTVSESSDLNDSYAGAFHFLMTTAPDGGISISPSKKESGVSLEQLVESHIQELPNGSPLSEAVTNKHKLTINGRDAVQFDISKDIGLDISYPYGGKSSSVIRAPQRITIIDGPDRIAIARFPLETLYGDPEFTLATYSKILSSLKFTGK